MANPAPFLQTHDLAGISDLELLARTVVEGFLIGLHRSPHSGASIEFAQYRPYVQGDDPRFIDWKLFGRTDRLHVKQFHEDTNLRCTILFDCSASMDYGSGEITKFHYARILCASLAMLLSTQKDAPGFIAYDEETRVYLPPRSDGAHLRRILSELQNLEPGRATDSAGTLKFLGDIIRPRGMVVLVSDLLHEPGEMIRHLRSLRARSHDVMILQISDPAERTFPFDRTVTLLDAETADERFAVPDAIRREYLENRRAHFGKIRRACVENEIDIEEFSTDEHPGHVLKRFVHHRNRMLMASGRTRRGPGGRGG